MLDLSTILARVNVGRIYLQNLLDTYGTSLNFGVDKKSPNLDILKLYIIALNYDIVNNINTDKTQAIYVLLDNLLAEFTASYVIDPSVQIPNTELVVNGEGIRTVTYTEINLIDMLDGFYKIASPLLDGEQVLSLKITQDGQTYQKVPEFENGFIINVNTNNAPQTITLKVG